MTGDGAQVTQNTGGVFEWGPLDRAPLSELGRDAAHLAGLSADLYRAGCALLNRAPLHLLDAWTLETLSTADAYAALIRWEAGALL
ncbi:hypothetical protein [uncultured Deinococcus sp.]|uniref:hypothetical protein n=1 Tax=uncultured Deinococcus sp. TaxID=158789 RepID=UPI0025D0C49A|nr:hypothetical protein [uncultured Deinococcus sp.]